jgi:urease subunit alpha
MFGALGRACGSTGIVFMSRAAQELGVGKTLGLQKRVVAVRGTRTIRKRDLIHNGYLPQMEIDPQTYEVRADGQLLTCEPARELPLAQKYFLF